MRPKRARIEALGVGNFPLSLLTEAEAEAEASDLLLALQPCQVGGNILAHIVQTRVASPDQRAEAPGAQACRAPQPTFITASVCSSSQPTRAWPDSWKATTLCSSLERILLFLAVPERSQGNSRLWALPGTLVLLGASVATVTLTPPSTHIEGTLGKNGVG